MNSAKSPGKLVLNQETIRLLSTIPHDEENFVTALRTYCVACDTRQLGCTI